MHPLTTGSSNGSGITPATGLPATFGSIGTPSPVVTSPNGSWAVTDWYVSNAGNDANDGRTALTPVKTIQGGIVAKWGTWSPVLSQTTTVHILDSQAVGVEQIVPSPILAGGVNFIISGTLVAVGAPFTVASVTAKNRATPQLLQLVGAPAGCTAGQLVTNTSRSSSAFVDLVSGTTLTMTQPLSGVTTTPGPSVIPTEDDNWTGGAEGNVFQLYSMPTLNLKFLGAYGGDTKDATDANPCVWVQHVHVPDVSGSIGFSSMVATSRNGVLPVLAECWVDPYFIGQGMAGAFLPVQALGCWLNGGYTADNTLIVGGAGFTQGANVFGGCYLQNYSGLDLDHIVHGGLNCHGGAFCLLSYVYLDAAGQTTIASAEVRIEKNYAATTPQVWGPGTIDVDGGGLVVNESTTTWAACLTVASLLLDGVASGTAPAGSGTFTSNGVTQVDVTVASGSGNYFPANATISLSLKTLGSTHGTNLPQFSQAQTAGSFHTKNATAVANDTYNWVAANGTDTLNAANLDAYKSLTNPRNGSGFVQV